MGYDSAAALIREGEGRRLKVYDDATGALIVRGSTVSGHPTIGYGRNLAARGITKDEAEYLLSHDLAYATEQAQTLQFWSLLSPPRQGVLIDLVHNMGMAGLLSFRKMLAALNKGEYTEAAKQLLSSRYAEQVGYRARRNAEILHSGRWDPSDLNL